MPHLRNKSTFTLTEGAQIIGQQGTYTLDGFKIRVAVRDLKHAYGRTTLQVEQVGVENPASAWVNSDKVVFDELPAYLAELV